MSRRSVVTFTPDEPLNIVSNVTITLLHLKGRNINQMKARADFLEMYLPFGTTQEEQWLVALKFKKNFVLVVLWRENSD